ncbi:MAG TPA: DUF1127 domain-containing protein [Paracoccaceae bacterium]|nr:DUF1127 domain-containing protein [Paracoccaceae bacterium]
MSDLSLARPPVLVRLAHPVLAMLRMVWRWCELARQRQALSRLEAEGLADIGICKTDARREAQRPRWDAPRHWMG